MINNPVDAVFGKLRILAKAKQGFECICQCGNKVTVEGHALKSGHTTSCGCARRKIKKDITGQRFSRLLVKSWSYDPKHKQCRWQCLCDCGNLISATHTQLKLQQTRSCGCLRIDNATIANQLPSGEAAKNRLLAQYKSDASKRNLIFEISRAEFFVLTSGACFYCGSPPAKQIGLHT